MSDEIKMAALSAAVAAVVTSAIGGKVKGDKGDKGAPGVKGDDGAKGDKGDPGDTGPAGASPTGRMFTGPLGGTRSFHVPHNVASTSGTLSFPAGGMRAWGVTAPVDRHTISVLVGVVADKIGTVQIRDRTDAGAVGAILAERTGLPNNGSYHDLDFVAEPGRRYFIVFKSADALSIAASFVTRPEATGNLFIIPSDNFASSDDGASWYADTSSSIPRVYFGSN